MTELEFLKQRVERLEEIVEQLQEAIKKTPAKRNRLTSFEESPVYNFEVFKAVLVQKGWTQDQIHEYYESAKLYSESKGAKYNNWISAVESWKRKDDKQNNKLFKSNGKQTSAFEQRNAERFAVGSIADAILANRNQ